MRILMSSRWLLFFLLITTCVLLTSAGRKKTSSKNTDRGGSSRDRDRTKTRQPPPPRKFTPPSPRKPTTPPPRKLTPPPPRKLTPPPPRKPTTPPPRKLTPPPPRKPTTPPPRKLTPPPPWKPTTPPPRKLTPPPPRKPTNPPPRKLTTPRPRKPTTPTPRKLTTPTPRKLTTPTPRKLTTPTPRKPTPTPKPPAINPNQGSPNRQPVTSSENGSPNVRQPHSGEAPPLYPGGGVPGANYPRQPGMQSGNYPQQGGEPGANYPRQPGMPGGNYPQQGGVPGAKYPRQPGMPGGVNYPQQGSVNYLQQGGVNYPRQPGTFGQPGVGIPGANYPRQTYTYPANTMGSNVWQPQSDRPATAHLNYGGLPTVSNMYSKPEKKKGLLGSLMSVGSYKPKKNKYFGGGVPGANYPRQPGMSNGNYPQQGGVPGANYLKQPGMIGGNYPQQGGVPGANYPRQPGMPGDVNYPQQESVKYPQQGGVNYPRQPETFGQPGVGIPGANYPRQTYTYSANTLGSNVWQPQSGRPATAHLNYGGLPTGSNMYSKPEKKKGFLGSLMSVGSHKPKKNKYFGGGVPGANYPREPGMSSGNYPQEGGVPGANYLKQPGMIGGNYPQQGGVPGANYPRQPGMLGDVNYLQQGSFNYPQQDGVNYPRQPETFGQPGVGIPGANYPIQTYTYPANTLGSNVWQPQSGRPATAHLNYGGLPTGSNMYSKPEKKKVFLGSLMSVGSHKPKKNKYFGGGVPGANYPREPGMSSGNYPQEGGVPGANYLKQPGMIGGNYPQQGGVPIANYPRQPGMLGDVNYPQQGSVNYPQQDGVNYPQQPETFGQPGVGIPGANYPRQTYTYPANTLGSNVWRPQSGRPAPAYMNYGGLPTGSNMYSKPEKKKGFLGSLMSVGSHKRKKNKYFRSQPSPYGMGGMGPMGGGFMGKHGSKAVMHTILPYMAMRRRPNFYRPSFGFYPIFWPSPFYHHHFHYGHYGHTHYDIYNKEYVGRCNRPLTPGHGKVVCNSTQGEVYCDVKCEEGYLFPDNTTSKSSKCWHVTGVWKPMKNFPACQPVCNRICLNGGTCIGPNVCGCPPEYRGLQCEFYFLNCDVRKLSKGVKIKWVCTHSKNETTCKIKCKDSLQFATPTEEVYKCSSDGVWTPNSIPECVSPESVTNATDVSTHTSEATTQETVTITPEPSKRK